MAEIDVSGIQNEESMGGDAEVILEAISKIGQENEVIREAINTLTKACDEFTEAHENKNPAGNEIKAGQEKELKVLDEMQAIIDQINKSTNEYLEELEQLVDASDLHVD